MKMRPYLVTAAICLVMLAAGLTFSAITVTKNIASQGSVNVAAGLGIYSDVACQNNLTAINWGTVSPGASATYTCYIKNVGSGTSLLLNMTTSAWNPTSANGPIALTWNQEGTVLLPNQTITAVFTLNISSAITGISNFNVQITITGTQVQQE